MTIIGHEDASILLRWPWISIFQIDFASMEVIIVVVIFVVLNSRLSQFFSTNVAVPIMRVIVSANDAVRHGVFPAARRRRRREGVAAGAERRQAGAIVQSCRRRLRSSPIPSDAGTLALT